jgi:hypothetical protein
MEIKTHGLYFSEKRLHPYGSTRPVFLRRDLLIVDGFLRTRPFRVFQGRHRRVTPHRE